VKWRGKGSGWTGELRSSNLVFGHARRKVVETGVAHGVTSRFILGALENNQSGNLWSIDRPPMEKEWVSRIGTAVGDRFPDRWSYVRGSSRRRTPGVLSHSREIDLFVNNSLHSERNFRFEMGFRSFRESLQVVTALFASRNITPRRTAFSTNGVCSESYLKNAPRSHREMRVARKKPRLVP
jgi:hypothetical protein